MLKRFLLGQWFFPPGAVCSTLFLLFGWLVVTWCKVGCYVSSSLEQASDTNVMVLSLSMVCSVGLGLVFACFLVSATVDVPSIYWNTCCSSWWLADQFVFLACLRPKIVRVSVDQSPCWATGPCLEMCDALKKNQRFEGQLQSIYNIGHTRPSKFKRDLRWRITRVYRWKLSEANLRVQSLCLSMFLRSRNLLRSVTFAIRSARAKGVDDIESNTIVYPIDSLILCCYQLLLFKLKLNTLWKVVGCWCSVKKDNSCSQWVGPGSNNTSDIIPEINLTNWQQSNQYSHITNNMKRGDRIQVGVSLAIPLGLLFILFLGMLAHKCYRYWSEKRRKARLSTNNEIPLVEYHPVDELPTIDTKLSFVEVA